MQRNFQIRLKCETSFTCIFLTTRPIIRIKLIYYAYCLNFDLQSAKDVNGENPTLASKILCLPKQIKRSMGF